MARASLAGLSTLGVTLLYGVETSKGVKPESFTYLDRINSIGGITMDVEQIDASALEDYSTRYVAGRGDTGGTWEVVVNYTAETSAQWAELISAYNTGMQSELQTWFEVVVPNMSDGLFVIAQPPQEIPMPEIGQNELLTVTFTLTVVEYKGASTKVVPA